jgi:hypothetical protein
MSEVYKNVHGGRKREDLARELVTKYDGKYILADDRGNTYTENPLRLAEPQADVFDDKRYAEVIAEQRNSRVAKIPHGIKLTPVRISKSSLARLLETAEQKSHEPVMRGTRGFSAVLSIVGILGGIFFLSSNITGNAIANVSPSSGNILGAVLLVVGLVAGFFWVKKK